MKPAGMGATAALAATALLVGCTPEGHDVTTLSLPDRADYAEVSVRDYLDLEHEDFSSSIGDDWVVMSEPDPDVLRFVDETWDGDVDTAGGSGTLSMRYEAVGAGATEIILRYSFQGTIPVGVNGDPLIITVHVRP